MRGATADERGGPTLDGHRFDLIGKWLAADNSRRATVRALAAGAFAIGLGRFSPENASAKCVSPGKSCKGKNGKKKKCCGGAKCKGGKCQCPAGHQACGENCVDPMSDLQNCGQCGNACGSTETCKSGNCCVEQGPPGPHHACCSGIHCNPPGQNCVCT